MSWRMIFAIAAVAVLVGLNFWRYGAGPEQPAQFGSGSQMDEMHTIAPLPDFNFAVQDSTTPPQASRDLFEVVTAPAPPPPSKLTIAPEPVQPTDPDPREVALEAARVNMLNVRVTGIISSQSGLSAMVNAPFFRGAATIGTQLGNGIVITAVNGSRVRIGHSELQLQRDIIVGE